MRKHPYGMNLNKTTKPNLLEKYNQKIIPKLIEEFKYKNKYQLPRITKIVINMGVGEEAKDSKVLNEAMNELAIITGQRPIVTRAKKSISNFKIRKNDPVGCKVTLRDKRMYEFLDRFISVVLPRIRDFRGVPKSSFDECGSFSLGLSEQAIFPEINYDKVSRTQGMNISIVINSSTKQKSIELLKLFGMPFK